jgi:hypothetical protein
MPIVLRLMKQRSVRKSSRLQSLPEPICLTIVSLPSEAHQHRSTWLPENHLPFCVLVSDANTFLTFDWDMPNCRAICDGLIPALVAARTALTCPRVNETFDTSACRLSLDDHCFRTGSSVGFGWTRGDNLPRRFASWTDAVMSRSSSVSVRYLTALGRSLGRIWRCEAMSAGASLGEARLIGGQFAL